MLVFYGERLPEKYEKSQKTFIGSLLARLN